MTPDFQPLKRIYAVSNSLEAIFSKKDLDKVDPITALNSGGLEEWHVVVLETFLEDAVEDSLLVVESWVRNV